MSIFSEINRIKTAKDAIKQSIAAKGVAVDENAKLSAFPSLIDNIQTGVEEIKDTYTVTFIDFDHVITEYELEENDTIVYPEPPQHPELGINFAGWTLNAQTPAEIKNNTEQGIVENKKYICIGATYDNTDYIYRLTLPTNETSFTVPNNTKINKIVGANVQVSGNVITYDSDNNDFYIFLEKEFTFAINKIYKIKEFIQPKNKSITNWWIGKYMENYIDFFIKNGNVSNNYNSYFLFAKYYAGDSYSKHIKPLYRCTTFTYNADTSNTSYSKYEPYNFIDIKPFYKDNEIYNSNDLLKTDISYIKNVPQNNYYFIDNNFTLVLPFNSKNEELTIDGGYWMLNDANFFTNILNLKNSATIIKTDVIISSMSSTKLDNYIFVNLNTLKLDNTSLILNNQLNFYNASTYKNVENIIVKDDATDGILSLDTQYNLHFIKKILVNPYKYDKYITSTNWVKYAKFIKPDLVENTWIALYNITKNNGNYQLEYNYPTLSKISEVKNINETSTCEFISEPNDYYDTIFEGWFDKDDILISSNKVIETNGNSYDIKTVTAKYHVDIPTESKWVDTGETKEVDGVVYHKLVDPSTLNIILDESNKVVPSSYKDSSAWTEYENLHIENNKYKYKIYQEIKKNTGSTFNWMKVDFTQDCDIYWQSSGEQNYDYLMCTSSEPTSSSYSSNVIFDGKNKNITTDFSDTTWETYHVDHTVTPTLYFWMRRDSSGYKYQDSCLVALPNIIKVAKYNEKYVDDNGNELVTNDNTTA